MNAMIFAAGLGTRLKPLTDHMPKALVPVEGEPLLAHTLRTLIKSGANEVVVNVHHFAQQIVDYLQAHPVDIPVRISDESDALLDTGGGLKKAASLFTDKTAPILIHNVDILSNANLGHFYTEHATHDAALLVSERQTTRYLLFDDDMRLMGWTNIATGEVRTPYSSLDVDKLHRYAFSGIHLFGQRLVQLMVSWPQKFPIMDFYLSVCHQADIRGVLQPDLRLLDVGKLDTLHAAEEFVRTLRA